MRTYSAELIAPAVDSFLGVGHNVDVQDWLDNKETIALVNENGDLALFEKHGTWQGHYFFKSRGKKAVTAAKKFLDEVFNPCYNISVLTGLTPIHNLGARWLSRKIGFTSQGVMTIDNQPFEFFILINKDNSQ
jgi:hypothetical protein